MWGTSTLRSLANEDLGTVAEYDPLTNNTQQHTTTDVHSWPGLSQWLSSLHHRLRLLLPLVDGHPRRVGVDLPVLTSDDAVASLGIRLRWGRDHLLPCRDDAATGGLGRAVEQIVGAPVPQITESIGDCVQHVPKERVQNRDGERIGVVPVPQITDDVGEVTQRAPERMHARVGEQIVDIALPLILEKIVEMIQLVPLERIKDQIVEQIVAVFCTADQRGQRGSDSARASVSRAKSCWEADRGRASAPDQGGFCEWCAGRATGACAESFTRLCQRPRSRPNSGNSLSLCLLSVPTNESWSRFLWCPRPWGKLGTWFSPCLWSASKIDAWNRFLWYPRPRRKLRIASGIRSWRCQCS